MQKLISAHGTPTMMVRFRTPGACLRVLHMTGGTFFCVYRAREFVSAGSECQRRL